MNDSLVRLIFLDSNRRVTRNQRMTLVKDVELTFHHIDMDKTNQTTNPILSIPCNNGTSFLSSYRE